METAGSEQTSSAIMLWAKTRVYVCSGRAGGNERHLLFYARYEKTWSQPHPRFQFPCLLPSQMVLHHHHKRASEGCRGCRGYGPLTEAGPRKVLSEQAPEAAQVSHSSPTDSCMYETGTIHRNNSPTYQFCATNCEFKIGNNASTPKTETEFTMLQEHSQRGCTT